MCRKPFLSVTVAAAAVSLAACAGTSTKWSGPARLDAVAAVAASEAPPAGVTLIIDTASLRTATGITGAGADALARRVNGTAGEACPPDATCTGFYVRSATFRGRVAVIRGYWKGLSACASGNASTFHVVMAGATAQIVSVTDGEYHDCGVR